MNIIKSIKKRLKINKEPKNKKYPITLYPQTSKIKGRVLFSYIKDPLLWLDDDPRFNNHSNMWESKEIAKTFLEHGYIVDAINWNDQSFYPCKYYDYIFDIGHTLQRIAPFLDKKTKTILHITGSNPFFSIKEELKRVENLEKRTNCLYSPKRIASNPELFERSVKLANYCTLIGNEVTLNTFPEEYIPKFTLINVTASGIKLIKKEDSYIPKEKQFIWFNSFGAVHKGLDLLIEVFRNHPNLTLNIVGGIDAEKDFLKIYEKDFNLPNINYYGFLPMNDIKLLEIFSKSFCVLSPSCSEGMASAVATCLYSGMYPIISKNTGIDLPQGNGLYLNTCTIEEIEQAVLYAYNLSNSELIQNIKSCHNYSLNAFSRELFSNSINSFIKDILSIDSNGPKQKIINGGKFNEL